MSDFLEWWGCGLVPYPKVHTGNSHRRCVRWRPMLGTDYCSSDSPAQTLHLNQTSLTRQPANTSALRPPCFIKRVPHLLISRQQHPIRSNSWPRRTILFGGIWYRGPTVDLTKFSCLVFWSLTNHFKAFYFLTSRFTFWHEMIWMLGCDDLYCGCNPDNQLWIS